MTMMARLLAMNPDALSRLILCGETIGHGMQSAGLVRDFDGERVHEFSDEAFVFKGLPAISGSLTRNFITPKGPVLATASQRMLMPASARILVKWATWPGLFSAKCRHQFNVVHLRFLWF